MTRSAHVTALTSRMISTDTKWLSPEQVCEIVPGMTVRHLAYLREKRRGPRFAKPTLRTVLYAEADIHAWIAASFEATRP